MKRTQQDCRSLSMAEKAASGKRFPTCSRKEVILSAITTVFAAILILCSLLMDAHAAEASEFAENEQYIWNYLTELTGNPMAAAGIMGNLYYESGMNPLAVETGSSISVEREDYTASSQDGSYENFLTDGIGYGLAQWTCEGRKLRLLELAEAQGSSIGNLDVQLQLLSEELSRFHMLSRLSGTDSIRFASDYFLQNYESPQLQDQKVMEQRAEKGQYYYGLFAASARSAPEETQAVITEEENLTVLPSVQNSGYVYVEAQVPEGWGGEIQVCFHSTANGKDYSCSMNYIENQYSTGLWLPFGTYRVSALLPDEDGLCQVQLQDSSQETIQITEDAEVRLTLEAIETEDAGSWIPATEAPVVPPKPQEAYHDLPEELPVESEWTEIPSETESAPLPEEEPPAPHWLPVAAALLVIILLIAAITYAVREYRQQVRP